MQFTFTEEQQEFRTILRRFLDDKSPTTEVRRLMATEAGWERAAWTRLNQELGLTAVPIPEEYGGQGFGFIEHGIVLEEMGRALLCAPYFATTAMAVPAILNAGSEDDKRRLLPDIATGDCVATLAVAEDSGQWDCASITATAENTGGGYKLNGSKSFVVDGGTADLILVAARKPGSSGEDGVSLFAVQGDAAGLTRRSLKTMDETRKLARLELDNVAADLLGTDGGAGPALTRSLQQAAVCLANEMVGGAERLREDTMEYIGLRMQFGRAIASFQAIKHRAADLLLEVELAKSAAYYAAAAAADDAQDLPAVASLAKACASDAYMKAAIEAIQLHGGIGFTWDNDTHLWFKRAKSSEVFLGHPSQHRELMLRNWAA